MRVTVIASPIVRAIQALISHCHGNSWELYSNITVIALQQLNGHRLD